MKLITNAENVDVLYEDNHVIAVNKRVGDIVQGDKTGDIPLSEIVKAYLKKKIQQTWGGVPRGSSSFRPPYYRGGVIC